MDINAALANVRRLNALVLKAFDGGVLPDEDDILELADQLQAMDEWLSKGGFLPTDWER